MKLISKSELMHRVIVGRDRECFEHSDLGVFDVTTTRTWAAQNLKPVYVLLNNIVPFIITSRVTDPARVMQLDEASWRRDPGLAVIIDAPDGEEHMLIDGSHRALRRYAERETEMLLYMVPMADVIRPTAGWIRPPGVDWGDEIVGGKIVKR